MSTVSSTFDTDLAQRRSNARLAAPERKRDVDGGEREREKEWEGDPRREFTRGSLNLVRSWHSPRALWILKSWHMEARSERKEHRLTLLLSSSSSSFSSIPWDPVGYPYGAPARIAHWNSLLQPPGTCEPGNPRKHTLSLSKASLYSFCYPPRTIVRRENFYLAHLRRICDFVASRRVAVWVISETS